MALGWRLTTGCAAPLSENPMPRCLVPGFNGALFSPAWREALWAKFFTAAPQRQRRSVERYSVVKRPEDPGQAPRHQSKDRSQMAQAQLRRRSADRSETAELNRAVDRGGGDGRRVPSAHAVAARRLPLCAAADDPAPNPIITASLSETAWQSRACRRLRTRAPRNENSKPTRSAI